MIPLVYVKPPARPSKNRHMHFPSFLIDFNYFQRICFWLHAHLDARGAFLETWRTPQSATPSRQECNAYHMAHVCCLLDTRVVRRSMDHYVMVSIKLRLCGARHECDPLYIERPLLGQPAMLDQFGRTIERDHAHTCAIPPYWQNRMGKMD